MKVKDDVILTLLINNYDINTGKSIIPLNYSILKDKYKIENTENEKEYFYTIIDYLSCENLFYSIKEDFIEISFNPNCVKKEKMKTFYQIILLFSVSILLFLCLNFYQEKQTQYKQSLISNYQKNIEKDLLYIENQKNYNNQLIEEFLK